MTALSCRETTKIPKEQNKRQPSLQCIAQILLKDRRIGVVPVLSLSDNPGILMETYLILSKHSHYLRVIFFNLRSNESIMPYKHIHNLELIL